MGGIQASLGRWLFYTLVSATTDTSVQYHCGLNNGLCNIRDGLQWP